MQMEKTSLFLVLCLQGLWGTESISVTGEVGDTIKIKCSHSNAYSLVKYFCKGACDSKDILITSRDKHKDGKYSIKDEGNTFFVTIKDLKHADSGQYWCGIERTGLDTYNEVLIKVEDPDDSEDESWPLKSKKLVYIGVSLGVVLLALAIVLLIFIRSQKRNSNKLSDTVNTIPFIQKQETRRDITTLSANKDQDSDDKINRAVSSPPPNRPDDVTYTIVSFKNTQSGCDSFTPAHTTYSVIKHTSTDEATVYCNV